MTGYTGRVTGGRCQAGQRAGKCGRLCFREEALGRVGSGRREGPSCQEAQGGALKEQVA